LYQSALVRPHRGRIDGEPLVYSVLGACDERASGLHGFGGASQVACPPRPGPGIGTVAPHAAPDHVACFVDDAHAGVIRADVLGRSLADEIDDLVRTG